MSIFCRLVSRKLLLRPDYFINPDFVTLIRHIKIKPSLYKPPPKETHDQYNMRIGRPQSPHLTIYAPELTAMMSISHRLTGAALAFYTLMFGVVTLALPGDFCYHMDMLSDQIQYLNLGPAPIYLGRLILSFPICYHMCNGIRHLIWDLGLFLSIKAVYLTGYLTLISAFTLTTAVTTLL